MPEKETEREGEREGEGGEREREGDTEREIADLIALLEDPDGLDVEELAPGDAPLAGETDRD